MDSYVPVTPVAFCSSDISPACGLCLPSIYQGRLWLLHSCPENYGGMPTCEVPHCELKRCATSWDRSHYCVPCNSPTVRQARIACETTSTGHSPSPSPHTQTKGYVFHRYTPKTCQILRKGTRCRGQLTCFPKNFRPPHHCRLGSLGHRSYQNLGFITSGFSPSCYVASSCPSRNQLIRSCQYRSDKPICCPLLNYFSRNFQSLSSMPSAFPPLRYLCSGCRPLNCY